MDITNYYYLKMSLNVRKPQHTFLNKQRKARKMSNLRKETNDLNSL